MQVLYKEQRAFVRVRLKTVKPMTPFLVENASAYDVDNGVFVVVDVEPVTYSIGQRFIRVRNVLFNCEAILPEDFEVNVYEQATLVLGLDPGE